MSCCAGVAMGLDRSRPGAGGAVLPPGGLNSAFRRNADPGSAAGGRRPRSARRTPASRSARCGRSGSAARRRCDAAVGQAPRRGRPGTVAAPDERRRRPIVAGAGNGEPDRSPHPEATWRGPESASVGEPCGRAAGRSRAARRETVACWPCSRIPWRRGRRRPHPADRLAPNRGAAQPPGTAEGHVRHGGDRRPFRDPRGRPRPGEARQVRPRTVRPAATWRQDRHARTGGGCRVPPRLVRRAHC